MILFKHESHTFFTPLSVRRISRAPHHHLVKKRRARCCCCASRAGLAHLVMQEIADAGSSSRHRHRKHKSKKHKHESHKEKRRHSSSSEDEEQAPLLPHPLPLQVEPWHSMQFQLIDCINPYHNGEPDSSQLRGQARSTSADCVDMSNFDRLMAYLRKTFELDEISVVLRVPVRTRSACTH